VGNREVEKMQPGTRVEWAGIVEAREDDDPRDTGGCSRHAVDNAGIVDIFVCQPPTSIIFCSSE
jgi:hypothetical protein